MKLVEAWGSRRVVDMFGAELDYRREPVRPELPGFVDASALLGPGVFVLLDRGVVVYVGKASSTLLPKVAAIRADSRPKWLPKVRFDEVLIRRVPPDQLSAVYSALLAEFRPKHNTEVAPPPVAISAIPRRRL